MVVCEACRNPELPEADALWCLDECAYCPGCWPGDVTSHDAEQRIRGRLADWYSPDEVEAWLNTPQVQLDGATAIDLISAGRGAEVDRVLDRMDGDAYL